MKRRLLILLLGGICPLLLFSQIDRRERYDLNHDKVLYTIGYSHLDSEWNWTYPTSIDEYIKNIMTENFHLFKKYPDYVFNFTGSRRYEMMKEYYPDLFKKVVYYIKQGRWYVSGSSVDEGEVNISSSESLIRQVLYGNNYFRKEFGVASEDYMLPDCFGFLANMPTIWHYCGLLGFSTQKLTWHSAAGIPFNVGVWNGPDGKGVIAALNATSYSGGVVPRLDLDPSWVARLNEDQKKYGISFDYRYYGVGDQGGAPRERDVKNVIGSLQNPDSKFKVVLTSSDQMYKDITPGIRKKLPRYTGDLLLTEHSAGSLTSEAYMKRLDRKNELLAKAAEQLASIADWEGNIPYPFATLNPAWELVLGSQFHDILPGTAIPAAYTYAWNDEFIAANGFAGVIKNSMQDLSRMLNTQGKGKSIVVYNPVAQPRQDVVNATLHYATLPENVQVYNDKGEAVPTQIIKREGQTMQILFLANVPSVGLTVYDVRPVTTPANMHTDLSVTDRTIENRYYKVTLGDNGDITSIYDKQAKKEILSAPSRLAFLHEEPTEWPSWNMDWRDRKNPPIGYMDQGATLKVIEQGPVQVGIEVKRHGMNSSITQIVSLSAGEAGKHVAISNVVDWRSQGVSLKATFPLTVSNPEATYNLGVGTIERSDNDSLKFEVPSKKWFDLTDQSGKYGVTILENCKYGSDKPNDNTLRLTLLYTPAVNPGWDWCRYQDTQDWGEHRFSYGIYGHQESWQQGLSSWEGKKFNQPLLAFEVPQHPGKLGKAISFVSANTPEVGIMAFKKMEQGDYYLIRVNELLGKDLDKAVLTLPGKIIDAYEVNGQEQRIGDATFKGDQISFPLTHYTIRSFAVKLESPTSKKPDNLEQASISLPYNQDVMSFDDNRNDGDFANGTSIPAELVPDTITYEGIHFKMGSRKDEHDNAVSCKGQSLSLPVGDYTTLYMLAAASEDTEGDFTLNQQEYPVKVQGWTGFVGQWYNREFAQNGYTVKRIDAPYSKQDEIAWFASHTHRAYPSANLAYQYCYLYAYKIRLPKGVTTIKLPDNPKIKILAITVAKGTGENITPLQPLYDDFSNSKAISIPEKVSD
ncbi:alpha-mannosidase [Microbacter margulisiae]|uniref:Alpha-mannosidase n=1 Tax=Microbacter margulisiae TaxID=1350067 RepID=A0A7W5H3J1_9PORP|nr:alpha-mannosidase [Microbacter margulisiae]MBB3188644.1 alpha-mannosidase [Microbacter margulisiae]